MILADRYDTYLIDLDGVIWNGTQEVEGASDAIARLRHLGKTVVFITNNSARTLKDNTVRLFSVRIPATPGDVVSSSHAVAARLSELGLQEQDRVHLFGGAGIDSVLRSCRLVPTREIHDLAAVVVGWDPGADFNSIAAAADAARTGVPFIATGADATFPEADRLLPGTGALLAAIETASGRRAEIVGKPKALIFALACAKTNADPSRTLVIGDRPSTDIAGARSAGLASALVLTGVTSESDLFYTDPRPDEVLDDLSDLFRNLPRTGENQPQVFVDRKGDKSFVKAVTLPKTADRRAAWVETRIRLLHAIWDTQIASVEPDCAEHLERVGANKQERLFDA